MTDLERMTLKGLARYTWGRAVDVHKIGEYAIVEYMEKWPDDHDVKEHRGKETGEHLFHAYVNGKDTSRCCESLDMALAAAIAFKHEGHSNAAIYFMRMLKQENQA